MNFLILSPQFPATNWNFCDRLKLNGINTLGIGYEPYEELRIEVRHALQDYIDVYKRQDEQYNTALEYFEKALQKETDTYWIYQEMGWIAHKQQDWTKKLQYLERALSLIHIF